MPNHEAFMKKALALAEAGRGWTSPNPVVGAVVAKGGKVAGSGFHARFGEAHAETAALAKAGKMAKGATLYVTLEPCNHHGKTPPCTDAILAAGIKRVVFGAHDPNALAAGGAKRLKKKGVEVIGGVLEDACRAQNAPFFRRIRTGRPFVTGKWAMTADGKIATARGDSKWITSAPARAFAHELRRTHDAVLVGIGTALADAPLLTVRLGLDAKKGKHALVYQPRRVILDSHARLPLDAPIWTAEGGGPIVVVVSSEAPLERVKALKDKGAEIVPLLPEKGRLPVNEVLDALAQLGIQSVLVEGGSEVLGSFLDAHAVDRACVFIAPKIVGGREGVTAVRGKGVDRVVHAQAIRIDRIERLGDDVLLDGKLGDWSWLE